MRRTSGVVGAAVLAATAVLTACGSDEPGEGGAGNLTIYSNQASIILDDLVGAFEDEHPEIDVEYFRGIDPELQPKLEAEAQTGRQVADVYIGADTVWSHAQGDAGMWAEPTGGNFTGAGEVDVAEAVAEGHDFEIGAAVITFGWNTEGYDKELSSYEDLLDPALANGKIGVLEPTTAAPADFYLWLGEQFGQDYVDALAAQQPRVYPGAAPLMAALTSGEIVATPYAPVSLAADAERSGAPVAYGYSEDGHWGTRYWAGIVAEAPNPEAAQLFADFLMSPEGQRIASKDSSSYLPEVEGAFTSNDQVPLREPLTADDVAAHLATWNQKFRG